MTLSQDVVRAFGFRREKRRDHLLPQIRLLFGMRQATFQRA